MREHAEKAILSFQGGRIKHHWDQWKQITSDSEILKIVQGLEWDFITEPTQSHMPNQHNFSDVEKMAIDSEIQNLLNKNVIVETMHEKGEFISPIFVRPKKNGTFRLICNLKGLNYFIPYNHFKMDSLHTVIQMMTPNCYMASVDLKDAYYCIPVAEKYQKYLKFQWNSKLYKYQACPMGLCISPRIFTKLLKPIFSYLRRNGHQSIIYIDDTYLQGDSIKACNANVKATVEMLTKYGFVINPEKSVMSASQEIEFLGFVLNSVEMTVAITKCKSDKKVQICKNFLKQKKTTIRELSCIIGNLVASLPAMTHGKLFYRQLENEKIAALKTSRGNFDDGINLSQRAIKDLCWWIDHIGAAKSSITKGQPDLVIETDSTTHGWGCHCPTLGISTGGPWKTLESCHHINVLELQAAFFALLSICHDKTHIHVKLLVDNTTAVAYIREQGGSKSLECNEMTRKIWMWAYERSIWISIAHIPGKFNCKADHFSRHFQVENEWTCLTNQYFNMQLKKLVIIQILICLPQDLTAK